MDKFTNELIHDKGIKRVITILEMLNNRTDFITSNEIARQLNCSNRTVLSDISQLKMIIPSTWELIGIKSRGYILQKPITESISPIIAFLLKNSILYKIIKGLYRNKLYTLEKWSQKLFISKQTLKAILNDFSDTIRNFNLEFKRNPLQLSGAEVNIRHFFNVFFFSIQKHIHKLVIPSSLGEKINSKLESYGSQMDLNLLTVIINVFIKRISQKHYIENKISNAIIYDRNQLKCFEAILLLLKEYYRFEFSENEKEFLKLSLFLISKGTTQQKVKIMDHYYSNLSKKQYGEYLNLLDDISNKIIMENKMKEDLILSTGRILYKMHIMNYYKLPIEYFLEPIDNLPSELEEFYKGKFSIISSWNTKFNKNRFTKFEMQYIASNMCMFRYSNLKKINALFLFSGASVEENIYYAKLKSLLNDQVNLHKEISHLPECDFIITNHQIPHMGIPVVSVYEILKKQDALQIIKELLTNQTKKSKLLINF